MSKRNISKKNIFFKTDDFVKKTKKMNKLQKKKYVRKSWLIFVVSIILIVGAIVLFVFNSYFKVLSYEVSKIEVLEYDKELNKVLLKAKISDGNKLKNAYCSFKKINDEYEKQVLIDDGYCQVELDFSDYLISIKRKGYSISEDRLLSDIVSGVIDLEIEEEKLFLAVNETHQIHYNVLSFIEDVELLFSSDNEEVITIEKDGKVKGISAGSAKITIKDKYGVSDTIDVTVSDIIIAPVINNKKPFLPCKKYTQEQAQLLDEMLFSKVNNAGKGTRAGVVAAARFLALQLPYRINYFLENGRLNPGVGRPYADGEGRFYHEGLYLSTDKYAILEKKVAGPAMWGCPMREYGFEGDYRANGLDCSGFVTWAQKNGGFDFGDLGSIGWVRARVGAKDLTWLGDFEYITMELLKSGKVKAGDLASVAGHVAMIIGVDDNHIYVAEEYYHNVGLTVLTFTYSELVNEKYFTDIVLMDEAYKEDGNYTNMWN